MEVSQMKKINKVVSWLLVTSMLLSVTVNASQKASVINNIAIAEAEQENIIRDIQEDTTRNIISNNENLTAKTTENLTVKTTENQNDNIRLMSSGLEVTPTEFNTIIAPSISNNLSEQKLSYDTFASEEISPYSGELTLRYNDISLPGRNGLDLNIGRVYQTSQANFGERTIITLPDDGTLKNVLIWDYSNYFNDRYSLGTGWSFNFPSVQVTKEFIPEYNGDTYYYEIEKELYYHTGNGDAYQVEFTTDSTDSNLKGYYKKDVEFKQDDTSYSNGQVTSYYSFTATDNTKQYFAEDGRLIGIKDRFNNEIKFEHTMKPVTNRVPNGSFYYDNDTWSNYGADYSIAKGRYDSESMKFNNSGVEEAFIISSPIQVEPSTSYALSASFFPTYQEEIAIEVMRYDAEYQYRSTETFYLDSSDLTTGVWNDKDFTFSTSSATRYVYIKMITEGTNNFYIDDVSVDKPKPLISKITDSIGREINFDYDGGLTHSDAEYDLTIDILTPDKTKTKSLKYTRSVEEFKTTWLDDYDQRFVWF